jgi:penicillin amidase
MNPKDISEKDVKSALPDTSRSFQLDGIEAPIEIFRDRFGIPHVLAQTTSDAFFGQGFVTAQDRLWHMDYDRKRAYGRWAEIAGAPAVDQDKMMRRFQIGATVNGDYEAASAGTREMFDAYTAGVNAFNENTGAFPVEYTIINGEPEPWQPKDCIAVYKVRHILMGVFEGKLWRARMVNMLGPEKTASLHRGYQPGHLIIVPPGHEYDGAILDGLKELTEGLENLKWLPEEPVEPEGEAEAEGEAEETEAEPEVEETGETEGE